MADKNLLETLKAKVKNLLEEYKKIRVQKMQEFGLLPQSKPTPIAPHPEAIPEPPIMSGQGTPRQSNPKQNAPAKSKPRNDDNFGNHYFDDFGNFLWEDNTQKCEIRIIEQGVFIEIRNRYGALLNMAYLELLTSSINIEKASLAPVSFARILSFYVASPEHGLGAKLSVLRNNSVSVYEKGGDHFNLPNGYKHSDVASIFMATSKIEGENRPFLMARMDGNKAYVKAGGLYCDLVATLDHEYHHASVDDKENCKEESCKIVNRPDKHLKAYWVEINNKHWIEGSEMNKRSTISNIGLYLAQVGIMEKKGWPVTGSYKKLLFQFESFLKIKYIDIEEKINNPMYIDNLNLMILNAAFPKFVPNP